MTVACSHQLRKGCNGWTVLVIIMGEGGGKLDINWRGRFFSPFCTYIRVKILDRFLKLFGSLITVYCHSIPSGTLVGISPGMISSYEMMTFGGMR